MPWTTKDVDKHKKGLSGKQKRQWCDIANGVLKKCMSDGGTEGTCAASAIRQANGVVGNIDLSINPISALKKLLPQPVLNVCSDEMLKQMQDYADEAAGTPPAGVYSSYRLIQDNNYPVRSVQHQGRKHIVVPVVMMKEGVHNGSRGPLLHTAEELGRIPNSWDGMPIVVWHPENNGQFISANSPEVIDRELVGRVYNTRMEGVKLRADAYIDEERIKAISPVAFGYISEGRPLEVSVGVFTEDEMTTGLWNGEEYSAIAHNHRPDHLALLPGGTGACSWEDGCGIRANQETNEKGGEEMPGINDAIKEVVKGGYFVSPIAINGDVGLRDKLSLMQGKLNELDTLQKTYYLQEMFDNYIIYEVVTRNGDTPGGNSGLFKQNYSISNNGEVSLTGDAVEVKKEVSYVAMAGQQQLNAGGVNMPGTNGKSPCCPGKVDKLIKSNQFVETDRVWLSALEEPQVDKLVAMAERPQGDPRPPMSREEAVQVFKEQFADPEKALSLFPADMADQMRHGLALHKAEKDKLIARITANSDQFTADELGNESIARLQKLASLIKQPEVDYSVLGGGSGPAVQSADDILPPPGIKMTA